MKVFQTHLIGMSVVLFLPLLGRAQDAKPPGNPNLDAARQAREVSNRVLLQKFDANKNGTFDRDEVERIGKDRRRQWDKNRDGKVDQTELKSMAHASREAKQKDPAGAKKTAEQPAAKEKATPGTGNAASQKQP